MEINVVLEEDETTSQLEIENQNCYIYKGIMLICDFIYENAKQKVGLTLDQPLFEPNFV